MKVYVDVWKSGKHIGKLTHGEARGIEISVPQGMDQTTYDELYNMIYPGFVGRWTTLARWGSAGKELGQVEADLRGPGLLAYIAVFVLPTKGYRVVLDTGDLPWAAFVDGDEN